MTAKPNAKMMPGSNSGATYFAFAKKVNVVLGIKPYGILPGAKFNVPNTTYFMARLRSAPAGDLFADDDKKVVKLQKAPENLWDAWPGVTWEKRDSNRASTSIGIFLRGVFSKDSKELEKLLGQLEGGKMTGMMADYLIGLAGVDNLIVSKRELHAWLEEQYKPMVDGIVLQIAKVKEVEAEMEGQVGMFGMQAAILAKVYGEKAAKEVDDKDETKTPTDGKEPDDSEDDEPGDGPEADDED